MTEILVLRTSDQVKKDIQKLVKGGYYRNMTEVVNEALRGFLRDQNQLNTGLTIQSKVRKK